MSPLAWGGFGTVMVPPSPSLEPFETLLGLTAENAQLDRAFTVTLFESGKSCPFWRTFTVTVPLRTRIPVQVVLLVFDDLVTVFVPSLNCQLEIVPFPAFAMVNVALPARA